MRPPRPDDDTVRHILTLVSLLVALWLGLSGHGEALLLGLGALSVGVVLWLTLRMEGADPGHHFFHLRLRFLLGYTCWLGWAIVKSNLAVAACILHPRLPVRPRVLRVPARQTSDLGRTIHANSITLTPGTVAIDLGPDWIEVHSLQGEAASLKSGEMDRRVSRLEDGA